MAPGSAVRQACFDAITSGVVLIAVGEALEVFALDASQFAQVAAPMRASGRAAVKDA